MEKFRTVHRVSKRAHQSDLQSSAPRSSLVIHARGGDFLVNDEVKFDAFRFYENAIKNIPVNKFASRKLVCSDKTFAVEVANHLQTCGIFVDIFQESDEDWEESFKLLMNSSFLVGSKSTFAWWAAALGNVDCIFPTEFNNGRKKQLFFLAKFSSAPLLTETALITVFVCFRTVLFWDDLCFTDYCRHAMGCRTLIVEPLTLNIVGALMLLSILNFSGRSFRLLGMNPYRVSKELHPAVFYYLDCVLIFALFRLRDISLHTKSLILVAILQPSYDTAFVFGVLALCGPQFSIRLFGLFLLMFFKPEFSAFFAIILLLIMMLGIFTLILGTFICIHTPVLSRHTGGD